MAEKSGLIKMFTSFEDTRPDIFADLQTQVHDYWDRGLLGMALDPNFPTKNAMYVLYTYDAPIGGRHASSTTLAPIRPGRAAW